MTLDEVMALSSEELVQIVARLRGWMVVPVSGSPEVELSPGRSIPTQYQYIDPDGKPRPHPDWLNDIAAAWEFKEILPESRSITVCCGEKPMVVLYARQLSRLGKSKYSTAMYDELERFPGADAKSITQAVVFAMTQETGVPV